MTNLIHRQGFPVPGFQIPGDATPFITLRGLGLRRVLSLHSPPDRFYLPRIVISPYPTAI